jgi:acyl transferase domain-containing protein
MPSSELSAQGSPTSGSLPPIAVIGFSLRFPGDAVSPESFWKMLLEARSASTPFPKDRLNIEAHYHPEKARLNAITVTGGHFITGDIAEFDAPFFSITAQEAEALDPQQRLIIETAYRALENAGLPMHKIAGSKTSVFSGSFTFDYTMLSLRDSEAPPKYQAMGTSATMLANRISWFYDLHGPSVNLDSACSSSMMAMDMACQSIWNGDSEMVGYTLPYPASLQ